MRLRLQHATLKPTARIDKRRRVVRDAPPKFRLLVTANQVTFKSHDLSVGRGGEALPVAQCHSIYNWWPRSRPESASGPCPDLNCESNRGSGQMPVALRHAMPA
jgi:hypothetical protein